MLWNRFWLLKKNKVKEKFWGLLWIEINKLTNPQPPCLDAILQQIKLEQVMIFLIKIVSFKLCQEVMQEVLANHLSQEVLLINNQTG